MVKSALVIWNLPEAFNYENLIFNIFMARLGHIVGECLLMTCLGYVFGLKSK